MAESHHCFVISEQFRGPPNSGNGGYVAGMLAGMLAPASGQAVEVTLRSPAPLERPLEVTRDLGAVRFLNGPTLVAEAHFAELELAVPPAATWEEACAARDEAVTRAEPSVSIDTPARGRFSGYHPLCFCCSPGRPEQRGLHVECGHVVHKDQVAAPWICDRVFGTENGTARSEFVWAALDCPGQMAWLAQGPRRGGLLGRMTARLLHPVRTGERNVVIGWTLGDEGRKFLSGTALFDAHGTLCAYAKAIWISPQRR